MAAWLVGFAVAVIAYFVGYSSGWNRGFLSGAGLAELQRTLARGAEVSRGTFDRK